MSSATVHVVGFPRESTPGDRRTLLTVPAARAMASAGFTVIAEPGIGAGSFIADDDLAAAGVRFADTAEVWSSPLVLRYKQTDPDELARRGPGRSIGAVFHAEGNPAMLAALIGSGVTAYSYEFVHEHDRHPMAAVGGDIAGVQAVLHGAHALQTSHGRGVLIGANPATADPARVVVIGCGNVGSAAARTAAALGAQVRVLTHTRASADRYRHAAPTGVRVAVNTEGERAAALAEADLVIGAILISTHDTAPMISRDDLADMKTGAVIVDATCGYGDGYLPTAGPVQQPGGPPLVVDGVLHIKLDALPSLVPVTATHAYSRAAAPYLVRLAHVALRGGTDPAIDAARIAHAGTLTHPVCREHAAFYGVPA